MQHDQIANIKRFWLLNYANQFDNLNSNGPQFKSNFIAEYATQRLSTVATVLKDKNTQKLFLYYSIIYKEVNLNLTHSQVNITSTYIVN